ncbi:MAG: T9SS type A sorting domain-containing protein [Bacteroidetes bacterium]|nr:T9SS type A sorting domain-containing protein [Bacteroidota bacterium]
MKWFEGTHEPMELKIVNAMGEVMWQTNIAGEVSQVIPFRGQLSSGVYLLVLQSEKVLKTERLIIQ